MTFRDQDPHFAELFFRFCALFSTTPLSKIKISLKTKTLPTPLINSIKLKKYKHSPTKRLQSTLIGVGGVFLYTRSGLDMRGESMGESFLKVCINEELSARLGWYMVKGGVLVM